MTSSPSSRLYFDKNHVQSLLSAIDQLTPSMELECRVGRFFDGHFVPSVSGESFNNMKRALDSQSNNTAIEIEYSEAISGDGTRYLFGSGRLMQKSKDVKKTINIHKYNARIALSLEHESPVNNVGRGIATFVDEVASKNNDYPFVYKKRRWSYTFGMIRYDLTMIEGRKKCGMLRKGLREDDIHPSDFTIEIELCPTVGDLRRPEFANEAYNAILTNLEKLIHLVNRSFYPLLVSEEKEVDEQVKRLTGSYRPFMQAITMRRRNGSSDSMPNLKKHMVTLKLDGERVLVCVLSSGQCFLYTVGGQVIKTCLVAHEWAGSIFDAELVHERLIFVFDCLVVRETSICDTDLFNRHSHVMRFSARPYDETTTFFSIQNKHFFGESVSESYKQFQRLTAYKDLPQDGLIFTSVSDPYKSGICNSLLKWKDSVTIDLMLETKTGLAFSTCNGQDTWVDGLAKQSVLFKGVQLDRAAWDAFVIKNVTYHGLVVEFSVSARKVMSPLRPRYDKPCPNKSFIIKDNLEAMQENITLDEIMKRDLVTFATPIVPPKIVVSKELAEIREFHNNIKRSLINRYVPPGSDLLDMCCGRLGDLQKWKSARVKCVLGIDVSEEYLAEAAQRFKNQHFQHTRVETIKGDMTCDSLAELIDYRPLRFQTSTCFFALHYFLSSPQALTNFFDNVNAYLKVGGTFMATCFDGSKVVSYLGHDDQKSVDEVFYIRKRYQAVESICFDMNGDTPIYGWSIETGFGQRETMLKEVSHESLVFVEPLARWLKKRYNWDLEKRMEFFAFDGYDRLSERDRAYSDLHVALVFKKGKSAIDIGPPTKPVLCWGDEPLDGNDIDYDMIIVDEPIEPVDINELFGSDSDEEEGNQSCLDLMVVDVPTIAEPVNVPTIVEPVNVPTIVEPVNVPTIAEPVNVPTIAEPVNVPMITEPVNDPEPSKINNVHDIILVNETAKLMEMLRISHDHQEARPTIEVISSTPINAKKIKVPELKAMCAEKGIRVASRATKAELIASLSAQGVVFTQ